MPCSSLKHGFCRKTPGYLVILLFAVPSFLVVRHGLRVLARYSEIVFYMLLWMPFIFLLKIEDTNWLHLFPFFKEGWEPIVRGLSETVFAFAGVEVLFFIYPFLNKKAICRSRIAHCQYHNDACICIRYDYLFCFLFSGRNHGCEPTGAQFSQDH
ncbi:GerAB/ArcD/ProY family transporter [Paenibacillus sp. DMB20]|uniref:GerAB/ArcD/ProY family transporter n=1 Tax=Paenibacillus sp. DMB20 TaxID=1642570 RepID=UPI001F2356EB|nr:GerAB/ArcD/ProY family transporter [Paenibacillus sp. DMB20]